MGWLLLMLKVGWLLLLMGLGLVLLFKVEEVRLEVGEIRNEILEGVAVVVGIVSDEIGQTREVTIGSGVLIECCR